MTLRHSLNGRSSVQQPEIYMRIPTWASFRELTILMTLNNPRKCGCAEKGRQESEIIIANQLIAGVNIVCGWRIAAISLLSRQGLSAWSRILLKV
ncbi:hypothetical protein CEXT_4421 [Caerostris extrusa]|uniref:Uncharacterized protein n=1 Tax=Caerostris extrusa TaxID=172846 RepID=A0AAV4MZ00_CAEEX|nr:hypothetical protein CEXT_4421 [Caerostris extrusa]